MRTGLLRCAVLATALLIPAAGTVSAHPDNGQTLTFQLYCPDKTWTAKFNGGPSAFHLDGGGLLFIWKEIDYVTPDGQSGTIEHGIQGFSGAPTVTCTYTGAVSHNGYTVTGFYTPAG
jgi:hypothetical protein